MNTVFEIFGIENKETKVSNLFSYYLKTSNDFATTLCNLAGINLISKDLFVDREYHFELEGYDNKHNYIDILIRVGNKDNPIQLICIENKIYAQEGYKQTERYKKGMEKLFPNASREYIFLTKNNSYIDLSCLEFKQVKYHDLAIEMEKRNLLTLPYANDFYEYYFKREDIRFNQFLIENPVISDDEFIDYLIWNARKSDNLYVKDGSSSKGGKRFFQVSKSSWIPEPLYYQGEKVELTLHLELGNNGKVLLHFETDPYVKFNGLEKTYGLEVFAEYLKKRDEYRNLFSNKSLNIRGNADLTVAVFELSNSEKCNNRIKQLMDIIDYIDSVLV